ncbi:hypothetical protein QW131_06405 [Roseibium salinum]|nr:hypothetical protein [Roseibium salinum]
MAADWEIVLLTNLPGGHNKPAREQLLSGMGIPYPVLTNSGPKGGAVAALSAGRQGPLVFIDDSPTNHASVHASFPSAVQVQFVADPRFRTSLAQEKAYRSHNRRLAGDRGLYRRYSGRIDMLGRGEDLTIMPVCVRFVQDQSMPRKDMPGIFDEHGPILGRSHANPFGTRPISPLDVVAKCLKWATLLRISRLARNEMGLAGTMVKSSPRPRRGAADFCSAQFL